MDLRVGRVSELAALAAILALGIGALAFFQRSFLYFPLRETLPSAATVLPGAEDVRLETEDGLALGGWFVPAGSRERGPVVIVFNGNAGHRLYRSPLAAALSRAGVATLLFDYRGYDGNPGSPTEAGLLRDARAAARYVTARPDVDPARVYYFGESLGAAVAVALAVERPPAGIILRSPFTSVADMRKLHYPLLPFDFLLLDRYPAIEQIPRVRAPLLVVAGERDEIVPLAHSRRLFDAANEPKRFVVIEGAHHNDDALLGGRGLVEAVVTLVRGR